MAALLVSVAIMGILMSVAMPVWRHQAQREKEAELAFRGEQWVRGIQQYQRKNGPGVYPPSLDILVQQRFVRKKWKDPITGEDFQPRFVGQQPVQGAAGQRGGRQGGEQAGRGGSQLSGGLGGQATGRGGVLGVYSKSTEPSIRIYNGATRYDQWQFLAGNIGGPGGRGGAQAPGGGGRGVRPGTGGRGGNPTTGGPGRGGRGRGGAGRGGAFMPSRPPGG